MEFSGVEAEGWAGAGGDSRSGGRAFPGEQAKSAPGLVRERLSDLVKRVAVMAYWKLLQKLVLSITSLRPTIVAEFTLTGASKVVAV